MPTFRQLREAAIELAVTIGNEFDAPDCDWPPLVWVEHLKGDSVLILDMPNELRPAAIVAEVKRRKAYRVARIESVWTLRSDAVPMSQEQEQEWKEDPNSYPEGYRPAGHPERTEELLVSVFDTEYSEAWSAIIHRDGVHPPTLDDWEFRGNDLSGRQVDEVVAALR